MTRIFFNIINKFLEILNRETFAYSVFCVSILFSLITYFNFSHHNFVDTRRAFAILYIDVALVLIVGFIVTYKIWKLVSSRKTEEAGSKFQKKLIAIFAFLVFIPSFLMAIFAIIFFHGGMDSWFTEKNQTVLNESFKVAESYLTEHQKVVANDALFIAQMLELKMPVISSDGYMHENFLNTLIKIKSLEDAVLFDKDRNVIARSEFSESLDFYLIKIEDLLKAKSEGVILINSSDHKYVTALASLDLGYTDIIQNESGEYIEQVNNDEAFLLVRRHIDEKVINYIEKTKSALNDYKQLQDTRLNLEISFALIFFLVSLLLVFSAIGIALTVGAQIVRPIAALIDASNKIKRGKFNTKVDIHTENEDMNVLNKTFNEMVDRINIQHTKLKSINHDLDTRIQFIENVLYGVSSGVIGTTKNGQVYIFNKFAAEIFNLKNGLQISDLIPGVESFTDSALKSVEKIIDGNLEVKKNDGTIIILFVKVVFIKKLNGFIITFDDLTELTAIQKKAAWADIARKIAHEIKNPLTPIQIAVERIYRKYSKEVENKELLKSLTDTTINQVEIIKRLINEFSMFSRMPEPIFKETDISSVIDNIIFLQKSAHPDFEIIYKNKIQLSILCDESLISQALLNIIKNSINAISNDLSNGAQYNPVIDIATNIDDKNLVIKISDNGPGFPEQYKDALLTPYFSLMPKGTGLGLAIVDKIIKDHNGSISFENKTNESGAIVTLSIPKNT